MRDSINKIQILPMSEDGFEDGKKDLNTIQFDYLLRDLPIIEQGRYYYEKSGISEPKDTMILFKFKTKIIGSGILLGKDNDKRGKYLQFDSNSISIYVKPIDIEEMTYVWPDFKEYGQSKKMLDINLLDKFVTRFSDRLIKNVSDEELFQMQVEMSTPTESEIIDKPIPKTEKYSSTSKYFVRDSNVSKGALIKAHYTCELNPEHKYFVSRFTGKNYVEAHHLIPMEFQDKFETSIDIEANVVSLCPVCHKMIHFAVLESKTDLILNLLSKRIDRLGHAGITISNDELIEMYK
ncbi:MAG TPA: hypothetical protein PLM04_06885 [Paludibacteraceae bacterium]|nr:hypothetical protein [Paludibacteraceae bacterium]